MSGTTKQAQEAFSARLRAAMQKKGYTSNTNGTGVDISQLARAAGTTYEAARRYAAGEAIPRPGKMQAIAQWLGVAPSDLMFGQQAGIDEALLEQCIKAVSAAQSRRHFPLSPEKTARLVAVLYQEAVRGQMPAPEAIDLIGKAMA